MKKRTQKKAFTLVELLVVISIIAILAGLSFPAISSALDKARQGADVSNVRQLGTIMFTYASDNNFIYPGGTDAGDVFTVLKDEGYLTSYEILTTSGTPESAAPHNGTGDITTDQVSFSVMVSGDGSGGSTGAGVSDNAHDMLPLLFSADSGLDSATPPTSAVSDPADQSIAGDGPWGNDGITVFRKGNSAEFLKANSASGSPVVPAKNALYPTGFNDNRDYSVASGK